MTETIPTFDKEAYVSAIENHMQWMQIGEGFRQNPNDPRLRQVIGAQSHYADPNTFVGEQPDVIQAYVDGSISDLLMGVQETTVNNSKLILTDIVDSLQNPGDAINMVLSAGLMPFEGDDRYASTTEAHKAVVTARAIIEGKNAGAAASDIVKEYGLGPGVTEAVQYHLNANPEGLLGIYASSVLGAKAQKLAQEFARKSDGALKKKHLIDYANYTYTNAADKAKPTQAIAGMAYGLYKEE